MEGVCINADTATINLPATSNHLAFATSSHVNHVGLDLLHGGRGPQDCNAAGFGHLRFDAFLGLVCALIAVRDTLGKEGLLPGVAGVGVRVLVE